MLANRVVFILALVGTQIAGYLTLAHLKVFRLVCGIVHGCDKVAAHPLSHGLGIPALARIPTAAFGLLMYGLMLLLCAGYATECSRSRRWELRMAQWSLALCAVLISAWLTFMEAYVIHGWCFWCLVSAAVVVAIFVILSAQVALAARPAHRELEEVGMRRSPEASRYVGVFLLLILLDVGAIVNFRQAVQAAQEHPPALLLRKSELIPSGSHVLGDPAAPYTLVEFGDYACTHCQEAAPWIARKLAQHPKALSAIFQYFPIADPPGGPPSLAARAAEAAGLQGKFTEMHLRLYARAQEQGNNGKITTAWVRATAQSLQLDLPRFQRDLKSKEVSQAILSRETVGRKLKIDGVPAFFIIDPAGNKLLIGDFDALQHWFDTPGNFQDAAH